ESVVAKVQRFEYCWWCHRHPRERPFAGFEHLCCCSEDVRKRTSKLPKKQKAKGTRVFLFRPAREGVKSAAQRNTGRRCDALDSAERSYFASSWQAWLSFTE